MSTAEVIRITLRIYFYTRINTRKCARSSRILTLRSVHRIRCNTFDRSYEEITNALLHHSTTKDVRVRAVRAREYNLKVTNNTARTLCVHMYKSSSAEGKKLVDSNYAIQLRQEYISQL